MPATMRDPQCEPRRRRKDSAPARESGPANEAIPARKSA